MTLRFNKHNLKLDVTLKPSKSSPRRRHLSSSSSNNSEKSPRPPPRIVLMGDRAVGTSSICKRMSVGLFNEKYTPEINQVMQHNKNILHEKIGGFVQAQFLDVEGKEFRRGVEEAKLAHAVAVVFDITNRTSFEEAQKCLDKINPRATALLIGNKLDLRLQRRVSHREGELLAKIHRIPYIETSAKQNYNIDEAFQMLLNSIPDMYYTLSPTSSPSGSIGSADSGNTSVTVCNLCTKHIARHRHSSTALSQSSASEEEEWDYLRNQRCGPLFGRERSLSASPLPSSKNTERSLKKSRHRSSNSDVFIHNKSRY